MRKNKLGLSCAKLRAYLDLSRFGGILVPLWGHLHFGKKSFVQKILVLTKCFQKKCCSKNIIVHKKKIDPKTILVKIGSKKFVQNNGYTICWSKENSCQKNSVKKMLLHYIVGLKNFPQKRFCQKNVGPTKIWFKNIKAPKLVQKNWSKFAQ